MFKFDGVEYDTIEKCCEAYGVSYYAVTTDVCRNHDTHEEAIRSRISKKPYEFRGESYRSKNACCKAYGLTYSTVKQRVLQDNIPFDEALEKSLKMDRNPNGTMIYFEGYMWKSKTALAKAYGIIKETAISCSKAKGISFTEAIEYLRKKGRGHRPRKNDIKKYACFEFRGKYYTSISQACGEYGIFYPNIMKSVKEGMSYPEALEYWVGEQEKRDAVRIFEFRGETFGSMKECCKKYGVRPDIMRKLIRENGLSKPEAMEECIRLKEEQAAEMQPAVSENTV